MRYSTAFIAASAVFLGSTATAHLDHVERTEQQILKDIASVKARIQSGKQCKSRVHQHVADRKIRRAFESEAANGKLLRKRWDPTYDKIQNDTCVLTPEVTEGPFYVPDVLYRQNITEGQAGIPLLIDIGVLNVSTCEPVAGALIDIWHVNATGSYSGFTNGEMPPPPGGDDHRGPGEPGRGRPGRGPPGRGPPGRGPPPGEGKKRGWFSFNRDHDHEKPGRGPPPPDGPPSKDGPHRGEPGRNEPTDNLTFLRGVWPTTEGGVGEIATIYPGYYMGRTVHIHLKIHTEWELGEAKKKVTESHVLHTGQIFFEDSVSDKVFETFPFFQEESSDGYWGLADVTWVDPDDISKGLVAYITVGIDHGAASEAKAAFVLQSAKARRE
ncbi:hypothetical protein P7C70_g3784, partial [Phenoliferia sp. Uapishka_3]